MIFSDFFDPKWDSLISGIVNVQDIKKLARFTQNSLKYGTPAKNFGFQKVLRVQKKLENPWPSLCIEFEFIIIHIFSQHKPSRVWVAKEEIQILKTKTMNENSELAGSVAEACSGKTVIFTNGIPIKTMPRSAAAGDRFILCPLGSVCWPPPARQSVPWVVPLLIGVSGWTFLFVLIRTLL